MFPVVDALGPASHLRCPRAQIFSDKTGTLTCNSMAFVRASVGGVAYGPTPEELAALRAPDGPVPRQHGAREFFHGTLLE